MSQGRAAKEVQPRKQLTRVDVLDREALGRHLGHGEERIHDDLLAVHDCKGIRREWMCEQARGVARLTVCAGGRFHARKDAPQNL